MSVCTMFLDAKEQQICQELWNATEEVPQPFPELIRAIAKECAVETYEVTSVMWDMVDNYVLRYGADAKVRRMRPED